eukprot:233482_1
MKTYGMMYKESISQDIWYSDQYALISVYDNIKYHQRFNIFQSINISSLILWLDHGLFNYSKHCKSFNQNECPFIFIRYHKFSDYDKINTAKNLLHQEMKCNVLYT